MKYVINSVNKRTIADGESVTLTSRGEDGLRHIFDVTGHEPYFYIRDYLPIPKDGRITNIVPGLLSYDRKYTTKQIKVKHSIDVANKYTREGVRFFFDAQSCYEDDVLYVSRWLIDQNLLLGFECDKQGLITTKDLRPCKFFIPMKIQHADIEVFLTKDLNMNDMDTIKQAPCPITCLSSVNSYHPERVHTFGWSSKLNQDIITQREIVLEKINKKYAWDINIYTDERKMLSNWVDWTVEQAFDGWTAWNGLHFDIPYIVGRLKSFNIDYRFLSPLGKVYDYENPIIEGVNLFDTMQLYKRFQVGEASVGLNDVAKRTLNGTTKFQHKKSLNWLFLNNPMFLFQYNAIDAILDYEISRKMKLFSQIQEYRSISGCEYKDLMSNQPIVDMVFLREAKAERICLPSKREATFKLPFQGAFVQTPESAGKIYCVMTLDFKSLYPSIMISFNMGNDTLDPNGTIMTPAGGPRFKKDFQSFVSKVLKKLLNYRESIRASAKKEKDPQEKERLESIQTLIKYLTNSVYGVLGNKDFRLFERSIAEAITGTARWMVKDIARVCNELGYKVVYGDTDSVFILPKKQFGKDSYDDVVKECLDLEKLLNKYLQSYTKMFNLYENMFKIKAEKIWYVLRIVEKKGTGKKGEKQAAKKRYYGALAWEEGEEYRDEANAKFKVVGLKRTDNSALGSEVLDTVLKMDSQGLNESKINEYIEQQTLLMRSYPLSKIAQQTGMGQDIHDYGNTPLARAVRFTMLNCEKWGGRCSLDVGSKVKMIYVHKYKLPAHYDEHSDVVALDDSEELPDDIVACIDYETQVKKTITMKLENIIHVRKLTEVAII